MNTFSLCALTRIHFGVDQLDGPKDIQRYQSLEQVGLTKGTSRKSSTKRSAAMATGTSSKRTALSVQTRSSRFSAPRSVKPA